MSEYAVMPLDDYVGACNAIREKTNDDQLIIKSGEMASQIEEVFDTAYSAGYGVGYGDGDGDGHKYGYDTGLIEGQRAEYDKFWDGIQNNGNRREYNYTFGFFPTELFYPKYDIVPKSGTNTFRSFGGFVNADGVTVYDEPIDLAERLESCGVVLDCSQSPSVSGLVARSLSISRLPVIDTRKATTLDTFALGATALVTVDKIILKDDGSQDLRRAFEETPKLQNIVFEGVIGYNGTDFHWSTKLSKASHISIMNAVTAEKSISIIFSQTAVDNAFETSEGAADGSTSEEWLNLLATKPNCTVSLA